jgi:hypothetical protein
MENEGENVIGNSGRKEKKKRRKDKARDGSRIEMMTMDLMARRACKSYNFIFPLRTEERGLSSCLIRGIWQRETEKLTIEELQT